MKKENLKKDYKIREMRKEEIERYLEENQNHKRYFFEDSEEFSMVRENKRNLFLIKEIKDKEKKERRNLDRDIKIKSDKINDINIKLIYHRDKKSEKEFRIFISYKNDDKKLIRKRLRNSEIDSISRNEKKMIEYFDNLILNQKESYKDLRKKFS